MSTNSKQGNATQTQTYKNGQMKSFTAKFAAIGSDASNLSKPHTKNIVIPEEKHLIAEDIAEKAYDFFMEPDEQEKELQSKYSHLSTKSLGRVCERVRNKMIKNAKTAIAISSTITAVLFVLSFAFSNIVVGSLGLLSVIGVLASIIALATCDTRFTKQECWQEHQNRWKRQWKMQTSETKKSKSVQERKKKAQTTRAIKKRAHHAR